MSILYIATLLAAFFYALGCVAVYRIARMGDEALGYSRVTKVLYVLGSWGAVLLYSLGHLR